MCLPRCGLSVGLPGPWSQRDIKYEFLERREMEEQSHDFLRRLGAALHIDRGSRRVARADRRLAFSFSRSSVRSLDFWSLRWSSRSAT